MVNFNEDSFKKDKNAYFLCHGGLGDLFINCGAIRFLSRFYKKIYLICPVSSLDNMKVMFSDINIDFVTYDKWYDKNNTSKSPAWPNITFSWDKVVHEILLKIGNPQDKENFAVFDWKKYMNHYSDLLQNINQTKEDAWHHFITYGRAEGRLFFRNDKGPETFEIFDWKEYMNHYKDLLQNISQTKEDAWNHFITYGKQEGRVFFRTDQQSETFESFDWHAYMNRYPDLLQNIGQTKQDAWSHFITYGKQEGRVFFRTDQQSEIFESFDWQRYMNYYQDLVQNIGQTKQDAWSHFITYGKDEGRVCFSKNHKECNESMETQCDFFVNGYICRTHNNRVNKITNQDLLNYYGNAEKSNIIIPWTFITDFYKDIHLDSSIYLNYFNLPSTTRSRELYEKISKYKIVFLHFVSSCGETSIPFNEWPHIYGDEYLIIDPDKNHYKNSLKYELANQYLNLLAVDYVDIISHAKNIYVCDSCFSNIVYPLAVTNRLNATNVVIYDRFNTKTKYYVK